MTNPERTDDCLAGGGEAGALMRSMDWAKSPLGPVEGWPRSLKTLVSAMLASRFAMRVLWGPQHIFLYNDAYRPVLGASKHPSAMGSRTSQSFREVWPIVGPMFERVLAGASESMEDGLLPLDRNGYLEECYFTLSYSPIRDDDGSVGGVLGVVHETTERVLAERRLITLRELASASSGAQTAEDACRDAARALGGSAADVPFALFYLLADDEDEARLVATSGLLPGGPATPPVIELGGSSSWALPRERRGGAAKIVDDVQARFGDLHAGPYPEAIRTAVVLPLARPGVPRPYGFLVQGVNPRHALDAKYVAFFELSAEHVVSAISNARAYQHEKQRAEELADLDRQKTAFFSNVSHELRTPLTLILGPLADALGSPSQALTGPALSAAHRNAGRLLRLVNSLLEFSRIEAGRVRTRLRETDLSALTRELASAFEGLAERAGLRLAIDCPPLGERAFVDREMWERIVLNLLSNAFKFTFTGTISVSLARVGDVVELRVSDTGVGIPAVELPRLFERFHRVEGTRARTHEGSGIGLALVQELVKLHRGTVHVDSAVGRGTVFVVRVPGDLPAGEAIATGDEVTPMLGVAPFVEEASRWLGDVAASAEPPLEPWPDPSPLRTDARVLVVDDSADMRDYVVAVLRRHFTVETAADGEEALRRIRERAPDLVLSDVMMPVLDGLELLRAVRRDEGTRSLPVVLLSASVGEESRVAGIDAGADDYLTKPFSARELIARVRTHIELGRLRARAESERRAAAEAERTRMFELFMQAPAAICLLRGPTHVYELANPPYRELIGGRDPVGKPLRDALPEVAPVVVPILDRVYLTGEPFFGNEFPVPIERDGEVRERHFNFVYKAVVDADGRVEGIAVVASDVTDQVRARDEAQRLSHALAASNRELDQFAYVASHDLKAPLRGIANLSQWIEEGMGERMDTETKEHMTLLRGRVRRLDALIDGILSYSRAGRSRDRVVSIDVGALLAETRDLLSPGANATVEIGDMPTLEAERVPLQQVFLNLMGNALKHADRADPSVTVDCALEPGFHHFRVRDNGPGIAPEYHERIFAIFTTLRPRDQVEGTGIGLSVVKKIVETRGGSVWVDSEEGRGATFHVRWPRGATS